MRALATLECGWEMACALSFPTSCGPRCEPGVTYWDPKLVPTMDMTCDSSSKRGEEKTPFRGHHGGVPGARRLEVGR